MEASFDHDAAIGVCRTVGSVIPSKATIPVISNLLIRIADGRMAVMGTDLDIYCEVGCAGDGTLATTVSSAAFSAALDGLRPGRVVAKLDGNRLILTQGRARRSLPTIRVEDFPVMLVPEEEASLTIDAGAFTRMLASVAHAQETNQSRYTLCGVFLGLRSGRLVTVATNGHVMSRCALDAAKAPEIPDSIMSTKTVTQLRKLLPSASEPIRIAFGDRKMMVTIGESRLVAKLIEGTYPDVERIIPEPRGNLLKMISGEMIRAIDAVASSAAVDGKSRGVRFELGAGEALQLSARDIGIGTEAMEPLDGEYAGEAQHVGMNSLYGKQMAQVFKESSVLSLDFGDHEGKILVTSEAEPDISGIIMPMRA
jgi:DNA polymerase-3 subunit beta